MAKLPIAILAEKAFVSSKYDADPGLKVIYNAYWGGSGGAKLFLGGITGGIYIKNGGNLLNLLGTDIKGVDLDWASKEDHTSGNNKACTTPTTVIKDCYTYIKLPSSDETIQWSGKYADDWRTKSGMKTYGDCVRSIEPMVKHHLKMHKIIM